MLVDDAGMMTMRVATIGAVTIVKIWLPDVPPPGAPFVTVIAAVPVATRSDVKTAAVMLDEEI